jgi:cytochrome P450
MRFAAEDVELGGQMIRRGELVSLLLNSANRDEDRFREPERLEITRQNNKHLSFGLGIHYCLGAPVARLESEIAINSLLRRLPALRLAIAVSALEWDLADILYGVKHLPVAWDVSEEEVSG